MNHIHHTPVAPMRLDKWLWAARFYKSRSLATEAIQGGKVHLNQHRCKAAHKVAVGDVLDIHRGQLRMTVTVCQLNMQRRPASEAQHMYQETEASSQARQSTTQQNRDDPGSRPDKKQRRKRRQWQDSWSALE